MSSPNRRGGLAIVALGAAVLPSCSSAICNLDEQCDHPIIITGHVAPMPSTLLVRLCINGCVQRGHGAVAQRQSERRGRPLPPDARRLGSGLLLLPGVRRSAHGFRLSAWSDAAPPRDGDQVEFDLTAKNPDWPLIHLARTITYTHTSVPDGENCDEQCTNAVLDADYP